MNLDQAIKMLDDLVIRGRLMTSKDHSNKLHNSGNEFLRSAKDKVLAIYPNARIITSSGSSPIRYRVFNNSGHDKYSRYLSYWCYSEKHAWEEAVNSS
jgi:hypothetical protein